MRRLSEAFRRSLLMLVKRTCVPTTYSSVIQCLPLSWYLLHVIFGIIFNKGAFTNESYCPQRQADYVNIAQKANFIHPTGPLSWKFSLLIGFDTIVNSSIHYMYDGIINVTCLNDHISKSGHETIHHLWIIPFKFQDLEKLPQVIPLTHQTQL